MTPTDLRALVDAVEALYREADEPSPELKALRLELAPDRCALRVLDQWVRGERTRLEAIDRQLAELQHERAWRADAVARHLVAAAEWAGRVRGRLP